MVMWFILALTIGTTLLLTCSAQTTLVCPAYPLVNVSATNNSNLQFSSFPPDNVSLGDVEYNPGALGPYYDIGAGVINVAQPGSLTSSVLDILVGTNGSLTNLNNINGDPQLIAQGLLGYFAGMIVLTALGIVLACSFCCCCCCFGICRLAGKCGGSLKQSETSYMNYVTIILTIFLILFTCGLIAAMVLAFFSNQQVFNSVAQFGNAANRTFDRVEAFVGQSESQVDTLFCQINDTLDITVNDARRLIANSDGAINEFSGQVYDIVNTTVSLSSAIENIRTTLTALANGITVLQANATAVNNTLISISMQLDALSGDCAAVGQSCNGSAFANALGNNFQQLPNLTSQIQSIQDLLRGINLQNLAQQGNSTFNMALNQIQDFTRQADQEIEAAINSARPMLLQFSNQIGNITNLVDAPLAQGREYVNAYFGIIQTYDIPRYVVGIIISLLAVVVVVFILLGVLCGLVGFRTDRAPYERTDISNCGGITLLCAAIFGFIIGFFLMLIAAIVFLSGGLMQKACEDLRGPDYPVIANTIDNPALFGGQYLISAALFQNASIPFSVAGVLNSCASGNATIFSALMLDRSPLIQSLTNLDSTQLIPPNILNDINSTVDQITNTINPDTFVPTEVQNVLNSFSSTGIDSLNFTGIRNSISQSFVTINITQQIERMTVIRNAFTTFNNTAQAAAAQDIIDDMMMLSTQVNGVLQQVDTVSGLVNQLDEDVQLLRNGVNDLLLDINSTFDGLVENLVDPLTQNISQAIPRTVGFASQVLTHSLSALQNNVGNCFPFYATYLDFFNTACEYTLDGLNGFWLSLGMCSVFLIPVIIFAIVTSHYYRRMKYDDDLGIPYDDSFPLKTY